jgi:integrase
MVEGYQGYLQDPEIDLASSTVETYMNALVAQFNRAVRERVIRESPCVGIKRVRADETAIKSLSVEEVERLKKTKILGEDAKTNSTGLGPEIKRAFLFCCRTGLRWSDVRRLTYGKIRSRQVEMSQQKTGKPVYVPVNDEAWGLISPGDRIPANDERVFPILQTDTDPNSYYVGPWGVAAGIPFHLTFHASRHTFIRSLLDAGVDIATVQALAGHSKMETTARYARASDRQKVAALNSLETHTRERRVTK